MKKETLHQIVHTDYTKYGQSRKTVSNALRFIHTLLYEKVHIGQINVTDWSSNSVKVIVGIPAFQLTRTYKTFNGHTLKHALEFSKRINKI